MFLIIEARQGSNVLNLFLFFVLIGVAVDYQISIDVKKSKSSGLHLAN